MTVNTTSITNGPYAGNDVADSFSYTFRIDDDSQLIVFETDDTGERVELILNTDYTVSGTGDDNGGLVTRSAGPLPTGYTWYIRSDYDPTQDTAFESQGGFYPEVHEQSFDKLTYLIQQLQDQINRAVRLDDGDSSGADVTLPTYDPGKSLVWDNNEPKLVNSDVDIDTITDAAEQAVAAAEAAAESEANAAESEANAETAATAAEGYASAAEQQAELAEAASVNAQAQAAAAEVSNQEAGESADQSALSASQSQSAASQSQSFADEAEGWSNTAEGHAGNAATSAQQAQQYAQTGLNTGDFFDFGYTTDPLIAFPTDFGLTTEPVSP